MGQGGDGGIGQRFENNLRSDAGRVPMVKAMVGSM